MTDEQTPRSGSRWEPAPDDETVVQATAPAPPPVAEEPAAPEPAAPVPSAPVPSPTAAPEAAPAAKRSWTQRIRSHGGLVGAAIALVLFSGIGGFAIGHAAAGPDRFGLVGERFPGGPDGDFHGGPHGDGVPPGFGDHDQDGFGTPPGSDDDSTAPDDGSDDGTDDDGADEQSGSTL
jgi:hypothetical protein